MLVSADFGLGEFGNTATPLFSIDAELDVGATLFLSATLEIARFVAAMRESVTTSERKRFVVVFIGDPPYCGCLVVSGFIGKYRLFLQPLGIITGDSHRNVRGV